MGTSSGAYELNHECARKSRDRFRICSCVWIQYWKLSQCNRMLVSKLTLI